MTLDTPPVLNIRAITHAGRGLTLPIAKALAHLMVIHEAVSHGWEITRPTALAEMREAVEHLNDIYYGDALLTGEMEAELDEWSVNLRETQSEIANQTAPETGALSDGDKTLLQEIITQTWALLTVVDREITGLTTHQADPGQRP